VLLPLQAGQLLLFLRQHLQLPEEAVLKHFKWAAVLSPSATQQSMVDVTQALTQHLLAAADTTTTATTGTTTATTSSSSTDGPLTTPHSPAELLPLLETFPEVLGWDVGRDLLPKLAFFEGLGPQGRALLSGSLWESGSSWLPGLRSWGYSVTPKLDLLAGVLGSAEEVGGCTVGCRHLGRMQLHAQLAGMQDHVSFELPYQASALPPSHVTPWAAFCVVCIAHSDRPLRFDFLRYKCHVAVICHPRLRHWCSSARWC
jgi:hypothetical protein